MTSRVLVTGGAGFIGSHLVDYLIAQGHAVNVLDDFSTGTRDNLEGADDTGLLRTVAGSVLDTADVRAALRDCDVVYHLAVKSVRHSLGHPIENHAVNASGTLNVLEMSRQAGVRRFVYCSSSEVYGNAPDSIMREDTTLCCPVTVYGGSKLAGEHYTSAYYRTYGLPTVIVRPFNAYGPRSHTHGESGEVIPRFFARLLRGLPPLVFGDGQQTRDFTYVSDSAGGIARAAQVDSAIGQIINIARGEPVAIAELAQLIAHIVGSPFGAMFAEARPGDVRALWGDVSRCRDLLGFSAQVGLHEGLLRYFAWLRGEVRRNPGILADVSERNWADA
jgi:UDP-glucose 4-epimerase